MRLRVVTRPFEFHLGSFQSAEVADHSLRPMHLSSSLWGALPGKDQHILALNLQGAEHVVHCQWQIERAQNKFTTVGAMHEPFPPLLWR